MEKHLDIYTDGSCWEAKGAIGWVMIYKGRVITFAAKVVGTTTSNRCEMIAVINALTRLYKGELRLSTVRVYSDSQYTVKMFSKVWEIKESTKNTDLLKQFFEVESALELLGTKITLEWIPGHDGNTFNELADELCGKARTNDTEVTVC